MNDIKLPDSEHPILREVLQAIEKEITQSQQSASTIIHSIEQILSRAYEDIPCEKCWEIGEWVDLSNIKHFASEDYEFDSLCNNCLTHLQERANEIQGEE